MLQHAHQTPQDGRTGVIVCGGLGLAITGIALCAASQGALRALPGIDRLAISCSSVQISSS
ncbi:hypothetical protein A4R89_14105 (plasmid) [Acetobacter ascendens]|nr:hypothetical protein A4R89_14105 [Acetobacter ascendens]